MVWIPGGQFWMGAEEFPDAQPWHRVYVDGFWMDKTEVTNEQFAKFVAGEIEKWGKVIRAAGIKPQ